jgi:hypothetical protein
VVGLRMVVMVTMNTTTTCLVFFKKVDDVVSFPSLFAGAKAASRMRA